MMIAGKLVGTRMWKWIVVAALLTCGANQAAANTMGAGISLGTGNGLSLFYKPDGSQNAYQGLLNLDTDGDFVLHGDMLFPLVMENDPHWDATWGVGALIGNYRHIHIRFGSSHVDKDEVYFGFRIPFDIVFYIPNTPLQVGAELAPTLLIASDTIAYLHAALLVRLVFNI